MRSIAKITHTFALVASTTLVMSCGSDDAASSGDGLAAPTELMVTTLSGAAHLTWKDNSDDETGFMVERMSHPSNPWDVLVTLPANSTQYHDATGIAAGSTYMYRVMAMGKDGSESDYTAEATWTAP